MKRIHHVLLACVTMLTLAGCGDGKQVAAVKALPFSYPNSYVQDPNLTVDQALDTRTLCDSVKWSAKKTDRDQAFVEYDCNYKGIANSGFIRRDKADVASAGDVYQWTYGPDGQPALSAVAFVIRYNNGTTKNFKYDPTTIMQLAADNRASTFDQAFSYFTGQVIPVKPASPITDTTYGNALTALYPGQSPMKAAALAFLWRGAPKDFYIYGIDSLGYPAVENSAEARKLLFNVNPVDVQSAVKLDPSNLSGFGAPKPPHLSPNKLFCVNKLCFDNNIKLVGRAPASVLAREASPRGSMQPSASTPTAANPSATDSDDKSWPADTPCIDKLEAAYRKDRQAHGLDDTISMDQANDFASTCKTVGQ